MSIGKKFKRLHRSLNKEYYRQQSLSYQYDMLRGTVNNLQQSRGTKRTLRVGPPTLANKIKRLERKVAHNTPGLNYFTRLSNPVSDVISSFNYQVATFSPSDTYVTDPQYRNEITGDTFYNKWLKLMYTDDASGTPGSSAVLQMRIVVYSPKLADTIFKPSDTAAGFATLPDPSAFNVYLDETIQDPNSLQALHFSRIIQLRNKVTEYNGSNTTMERGPINVTVLFQNTTNNKAGQFGWQLVTQDK